MSKIDPKLKKKLLKESQSPFKGLRRLLWIAFSGSALLGLFIMISKIASGNEIQARYYWNYVLNLEKVEKDLKEEIEKKLIKGL